MSYDAKCIQLARDFLRDEPSINDEGHAVELAQAIQDCIEDYMHFEKLDQADTEMARAVHQQNSSEAK